MGINHNAGFSRIIKGKKSFREFNGMSFLMLGKQDVNFNRGKLKSILDRIGFETVNALDISDYEGADIICDLAALVLSEKLVGKYDYIYDGGVLEHVFNFSQALINTSRMLKIGGRIIHDLPCSWVDHGFYSFSPTCLIDYYTANNFFVEDIYLMGYHYPDYKMANVISPDCRYNDSEQWVNMYAKECKILLICEAVKEKYSTDEKISFMQYIYEKQKEIIKREKILYSYEYKMEKIKCILQHNPKSKIAIYGSGDTANKMLTDLQYNLENIVGIYDGKLEVGKTVKFDNCQKIVLNLNNVHRDEIQYIVLGSENRNIIEILRQRVKHLKEKGVQII